MKLRTLHLTNAWHASSGGIGTFYKALLGAAHRDWSVRLVVPAAESRYEAWSEHAGIYHVKAPRAPYSPDYRVLYPMTYLPRGSAIREVLAAEQPNLVEVNDKYTLVYLAGLLRIGWFREMRERPAVVGISCERMDETLAAYTRLGSTALARAYMQLIYFPQCDHHITVSRHAALELERVSHGHKVKRGVWIRGMGVETARFSPGYRDAETRTSLIRSIFPRPSTLLLYAGRLAPEKNLDLLLRVMELLRPSDRYHLFVAGDGPLRDAFQSAAGRRCPGRVTFLGHEQDRVKLARLYANVDIFLHPNPREPFGIAPLEAMASGVPVVAPDSGGLLDYASRANSWLAPATPEMFVRAIYSIGEDAAERSRRVCAALATAQRLDWQTVAGDFEDLYRDLYARTLAKQKASPEPESGLEPAFWSDQNSSFNAN